MLPLLVIVANNQRNYGLVDRDTFVIVLQLSIAYMTIAVGTI